MNGPTLERLETLVRATDPVPDLAELAASEEAVLLRTLVANGRAPGGSPRTHRPGGDTATPTSRHRLRFAYAVVTFLLVLGGLGLAALLLRGTAPVVDTPTTTTIAPTTTTTTAPTTTETAVPTTEAAPPADAIDTPSMFGEWTWTEVSGAPGTRPEYYKVIRFGKEFVAPDAAPDGADEMWVSADAVTWSKEPAPEAFRGMQHWSYVEVGDETWAETWPFGGDGPQLWRPVGSGWEEVPRPSGVEAIEGLGVAMGGWGVEFAVSGGVVVTPAHLLYSGVPWIDVLGLDPSLGAPGPEPSHPGTIWIDETHVSVTYPTSDAALTTFEFDVTAVDGDPAVVEFRSLEDGSIVYEVRGFGLSIDRLLAIVRSNTRVALWVLDSDPGRMVDPSWLPTGGTWGSTEVHVVPIGGSWLAAATGQDAGTGQASSGLWISTDLETWDRVDGPPVAGPSRPYLSANTDRAMLTIPTPGGDASARTSEVWTSVDGTTWAPVQGLPADQLFSFEPQPVDFGWAGIVQGDLGAEVWASPDGLQWEKVPVPAFPDTPEGGPGTSGWVMGDTVVLYATNEDGSYHGWVGTLQP